MEDFEILFVDDDRAILSMVKEYLTHLNYNVQVVDNGLKALEVILDGNFDIVFTDFKMPDIDGLELLSAIKEYRPETEVIIVTGHGTMESAIKAMKSGSYDYLQKPFKLDVLKIIIDRILEEKKLKQENIILKTRVKERHKYDALVGISLRMQEIYEIIDRMRQSSPNVLIQGESGTGKELTAHVIHRNSDRRDNPFFSVNGKSFAKDAWETAINEHAVNLFKSYNGGTIFFNEIAEIEPNIQAEIARAIHQIKLDAERRLDESALNVRLIAATNRNLKEAIEKQTLQKDFVNCLNEVYIQIPPLKERKEDICLLINHFLDKENTKNEKKIFNVSPEALDYLLKYNWPGNVIQLENVIERAFALGVEWTVEVKDLPSEIRAFGEISKIN